jgi:hypothetical protein
LRIYIYAGAADGNGHADIFKMHIYTQEQLVEKGMRQARTSELEEEQRARARVPPAAAAAALTEAAAAALTEEAFGADVLAKRLFRILLIPLYI